MILSFDFGLMSGYAIVNEHCQGDPLLAEYGEKSFKGKKTPAHGIVFLHVNQWIHATVAQAYRLALEHEDTELPLQVVVEKPHMRQFAATKLAMVMYGLAEMHCSRVSGIFSDCHTGTLKKWATGHGKADKADMIAAARVIFPAGTTDCGEHAADAMLLAAHRLYEERGADLRPFACPVTTRIKPV